MHQLESELSGASGTPEMIRRVESQANSSLAFVYISLHNAIIHFVVYNTR